MIVEIATGFVSTITALSSVVKAIGAAKKFSDTALATSEQLLQKREPTNSSVRALAATTIDGELIEVATENIMRALDRLKREWRDPSVSQAGKDDALETANFVICSELRRIKKLNGNKLPGDDRFHELWASHGCESRP